LASPSPGNPTAIASDADSLELAAQLPADSQPSLTGNAAGNKISMPVQANGSAKPPEVKPSPVATTNVPAKPSPASAPQTKPDVTSSTPHHAAAKPQSPPKPSPTVAASRPPQTNNPQPKQAEMAQAPRQTEENQPQQRDSNNTASSDSNTNPNAETPSARRDRVAAKRDRNEGASNSRREPRVPKGEDANVDDRQEPERFGPKLIQWSGSVNREREVTIDLPGAPGTLEIPRVYRNRVGIVQPPTASNGWRTATVRVFGQGGVSFVVRWWPMGNHYSRVAERQ
jgi:hypothetical protein